MMSSSKSYLYGRPVTEWSTPPPLSSKARTAFLHKGALGEPATRQPDGRQFSALLQDTTTAVGELTTSESGTIPHDVSWQPLAAIPTPSRTPSHAHPNTHPPKSSAHRHSVPNSSVGKFRQSHHSSGGPTHSRTHTVTATGTDGHVPSAPRVTHHEGSDSRTALSNPHLHTRLQHSDPKQTHADHSHSQQHPMRRSLSDRQVHKSGTGSSAPLRHSSMDIRTTSGLLSMHSFVGGAPQPPMAYVAPLLGTTSKPTESKSSTQKMASDGSHIVLKSSEGAVTEETDSTLPAWYEGEEKDRIKKLTKSLTQAPTVIEEGVPTALDYRVSSGDLPGSAKKWKTLIETKDRIMAQKNQLIDRQKQTISRLQQEVREGEARLHQLASTKAQEEGGTALTARLRELESSNASLKAELSGTIGTKNTWIDQLSKKLDATEYELQRVKSEFAERSEQADREIFSLKGKVRSKTDLLKQLDDNMAEVNSKNYELNEHIARLNDYLGNMPTMEEHQALQEQVRDLRVRGEDVTSRLREKEAILEDALPSLHRKDELLSQLEREIASVQQELQETRSKLEVDEEKIARLEPENHRLVRECRRMHKLVFQAGEQRRHELQAMRDRHKERFIEATAKLRSQHKALGKRVRLLEAQLMKNSDAMIALNSELQLSQGTIGDLKTSVKELVGQNQELVEKNVTLQEATSEATRVAVSISEAQSAAAQQLAVELASCVDDFDSLITLSSSILEGSNPSASLVLGVRGCTSAGEAELAWERGYESQLEQVRRLQAEVERLRTVVSDQFATQVSSACNVQ